MLGIGMSYGISDSTVKYFVTKTSYSSEVSFSSHCLPGTSTLVITLVQEVVGILISNFLPTLS